MVGEIRDNETARLAINAALTGHLVLSTLHTNSAAGTIPRLIDMGSEPFLLVSTLKVLIAQRLVRKLTVQKEKYYLSKSGLRELEKQIDPHRLLQILKDEKIVDAKTPVEKIPFYRPKNTDAYSGRIGIYEILEVNEAIKNLIIAGATMEKIDEQARKDGMLSMIEDGFFKAVTGVTSLEEVYRVISE
jgi:type IV pilus assembly protein PilB